jgi:hypothetical protein
MTTVAVLLSAIFVPTTLTGMATASTGKAIPECSYNQLEVGIVSGSGAAAGNIGIPFIIANISSRAAPCVAIQDSLLHPVPTEAT